MSQERLASGAGLGAGANYYKRLMHVLLPVQFVAVVCGGAVMLCLLGIGLWEMAHGVLVYVGWMGLPAEYAARDVGALQMAARGLEFLFLAPLGLLLVFGTTRYVWSQLALQGVKGGRGDDVEVVRADLLVVKAFTISLFVAVLAANVVGRALTDEGLDYMQAISSSIVIGVLATYFLFLERLISTSRRQGG
jgi:hypothetical protein